MSRVRVSNYQLEAKLGIKTLVILTDMTDMRVFVSRLYTKSLLISAITALTLGCQPKDLTFEVSGSDSINGSVLNFSSMSSASTEAGAQSTCVGQLATLYSLDPQGKKGTKLLESAVDSSGNFSFSGVRSLGIDIAKDSSVTKYVIEFSCGSLTYQRFVTGASDQKLSDGTTLMAWVSQTDASASVRTQSAQSWAEFYQTLESAGSVTAAFSALNSNTVLKAKFQTLFGVDPVVLNDAVPKVKVTTVPSSFNEEVGQAMSVQATHWSSTYSIAYAWKIGSTTLSNASNFTYTPSANAQGSHTIQLFIGQNNGSGGVDTAKPYTQETFPITIQNSIPPTVPSVSRISAQYTTGLSATVRISTGSVIDGRPQNCKSFSNLALVEENFPAIGIAPLLSSSYDIDCTTATQQDVNVILSGTEGVRVLRMWARDAAGNISSNSQDVSIVLDRVSPSLTLTSLDGGQVLRGGSVAAITWSATELNPATNPISLEYSTNSGSTWTSIASSLANSGTYNWTVPSVNSANIKVRITMLDLAGNSGSVQSASTFAIDSTAPTAPVIARSSGQYSNSTTVDLAITCDSDYSGIFLSSSSTTPLSTDSGWASCAAAMQFTVATGDGTKTVYAYSKDSVGNVSTSNSVTMVLDQTAPTVSITTTLAGPYKGGASLSFQFSVTEPNITTSQSFTVSYSPDNGSTWAQAGTVASTNGPLSSQSFTYPLTFPSVDTSQLKLRVTAVDRAGNSVNSSATAAVTVDSTAPTISSFTLAGGATSVALPYVLTALAATDALSAISYMQFSESISPDVSGWVPFSAAGNFSLSQVNGSKAVRAWVRDAAGNVSNPVTYSIDLDFGSPPTLAVTSPIAGSSYSAGDSVPVSWTCSSPNGLDATAPISIIQYTLDDGATFCPVTTNVIDANGTFYWFLPATNCNSVSTVSKSVRVMVSCKSAAGVVSNAYSQIFNTPGWTVFAGDPWYATQNVNASTAIVTPASNYGNASVAGDSAGHTYYTYNNAIMKINASTGMVTTYAGSLSNSGCTIGAGASLLGGTLNGPIILGMNTNQTSILVLLTGCGKIISIDTSTATAVDWLTVNPAAWAFTKDKWFVYFDTYDNNTAKLWKVDLKTANNVKTWIAGTGTSCGPIGAAGSDAKLSTLKCGSTASVMPLVIANGDVSRVWFSSYSGGTATRIDYDTLSQNYLIVSNTSWTSNDIRQCKGSPFDSYIYCRSWDVGRKINVFNPSTELWETAGEIPFANNESSGYIGIGFTPNKLLVFYTLNALNVVTPVIGGTWAYLNIAGQPLTTMGNGGLLSGVAFSQPVDVKYNSNTQSLWVRNSTGHLRRLDAANSYQTSTVVLASGNTDMGASMAPMFINLSGNKIAFPGDWSNWTRISNFSLSNTTTTYLTQFMDRGAATANTYPPSTGTNVFQDIGNIRATYLSKSYQNMVYHSNGKIYLAAKNGTSDVFVFASNNSTLERVAGKTGIGGYSASDHGTNALGSSLTNVQQLMEISSGVYAGDLLVVDKDLLRRISISTESSSPRIYDVFNLASASGYSSGTTFSDFYYDSASETNGLGTGKIYFATSGGTVHKIVPLSNLSGGTFSSYDFTGTSLTGTVRLTLAPAGLLVLQPGKNRILRVNP